MVCVPWEAYWLRSLSAGLTDLREDVLKRAVHLVIKLRMGGRRTLGEFAQPVEGGVDARVPGGLGLGHHRAGLGLRDLHRFGGAAGRDLCVHAAFSQVMRGRAAWTRPYRVDAVRRCRVPTVATKDECAAALDRLAVKLGGLGDSERAGHLLERTVSCKVPDLDVTFVGTLRNARLEGVTAYDGASPAPQAQIKLTIPSDDLLKLVDGQLNFASAWAAGRIKVNASFGDLLRLRKIF